MDQIAELLKIISKNPKVFGLRDLPKMGNSNKTIVKLIEKIDKNSGGDPEKLFVEAGYKKKDNAFALAKMRLIEYLRYCLLFIKFDKNNASEYIQGIMANDLARFQCDVLLHFSEKVNLEKIASDALEIALANELHSDTIFFCTMLRYVAMFTSKADEVNQYNEMILKAAKDQLTEHKSKALYAEFIAEHINSGDFKEELLERLKGIKDKHELLIRETSLVKVHINNFVISGIYYYLSREFHHSAEIWERMISFLSGMKDCDAPNRRAEANLQLVGCCLQSRDFSRGIKAAEECLKSYIKGSFNYLLTYEYLFLIEIKTANYEAAKNIIDHVNTFPASYFKDTIHRDKWIIYKAYVNWIFSKTAPNATDDLHTLDIGKKDKKGFNVSILILETLYAFRTFDADVLKSKIETLKKYVKKYLQKGGERVEGFISLLYQAAKDGFRLDEIRKNTIQMLEQLSNIDPALNGNVVGHEIIPFEELWDLLMEEMENR